MWKTETQPESDGEGQTRGSWLSSKAHHLTCSGLQAREGGNALGSQPSLVRVSM
jgi:hypothetical protein